uniref:Coiled-coil domain-containing protein 173 n=1 Tax=Phallusia mammillata TaxID=59560 RepID=A0A6F9D9B2_9ASCI|nr:coiled-coil domain-containing protein 173 [Phallusia mammillata]
MATVQHANFIQYGRRTGKPKSAQNRPASQQVSENEQQQQFSAGINLPTEADLRQVKVLPRNEWDRIQSSLYSKEREMENLRQAHAEREALHAQSQDIVKHWSNTIAGQRLKKLEARKLREEKEEESRVQLDIDEAKFQAAKRKDAIDKAKTVQYFQTDRIKGFHGALLLTEVLKERDAQIELKKQKEALTVGKDSELVKMYRQQFEQGIMDDQLKAKQRYEERKKVSDYQQMQIRERNKIYEREIEEDKQEGEELRKLAKLHEWEQQKLEEVKRKEKIVIMQSHKEHQNNKAAIRALEQQQEEEEDDEIRLFAGAKKRMLKLRKEKEAELFKEIQSHKDAMINHLAGQLKQKVDDEDSRIEKAKQEREEKVQREVQEKQAKLKKDLASIAEHRKEQLSLKERREKEERKKAFETLEMKLEADRIFAEKQAERRAMEKDVNSELQAHHMSQINKRAKKERTQKEEELYYDDQLVNMLAIEEDQFQQYANKVITRAKEKGQNPYPLIKAAQAGAGGGRGPTFDGKGGIKPSYLTADGYGVQLPNNQRTSTQSIKSKSDHGEAGKAKKRLGFVW